MAKSSGDGDNTTTEEVAVPVMDINRYLVKNPKDKSIGDMLRVMCRGKIKTEADWNTEIDAVINRRVF